MAEQDTQKTPTPEAAAVASITKKFAEQAASVLAQSEAQGDRTRATEQATGTESAAASTTRTETKPTLTETQIQAAKHQGYTDDEIAGMTPQQGRDVERRSAIDRRLESKLGRIEQLVRPRDAQGRYIETSKTGTTAESPKPAAEQPPPDPILEEIAPDDDIDAVIRKTNALRTYLVKNAEENAKLRKDLQDIQEKSSESVAVQKLGEMDKFFAGLDPELFPQFGGKVKLDDLDKSSAQYEARMALIGKGDRIMDMHDDDGEGASIAQCLEEALSIAHKDQYRKSLEAPIRSAIEDRKNKGVARASGMHRQEQTVTAEERAVAALKAEYAKRGIPS